jgi:hypothetical protein
MRLAPALLLLLGTMAKAQSQEEAVLTSEAPFWLSLNRKLGDSEINGHFRYYNANLTDWSKAFNGMSG